MGGWGKIENKDHLSPAKAETRAELGNKLRANLTRVIDEGGKSEEILDIESQIRELGPHWRKVRRLD